MPERCRPTAFLWHQLPTPMTKGQLEAAITEALTRFEREYLGRGPRQARTHIFEDMIVVRLQGILSPAETDLSQEVDGVELLKRVRSRLIESSDKRIRAMIEELAQCTIESMHTDISSRTGERVFLFGMTEDLDERFEPTKG